MFSKQQLHQIEMTYIGFSLRKLLLVKLFVLVRFVIQFFNNPIQRFKRHELLKKLKNSKISKQCLIVATGPSSAKLDAQKIQKLQAKGLLDVITLNDANKLELFSTITPDWYVLADPANFEPISESETHNQLQLWDYITRSQTSVFIPDRFQTPVPLGENKTFHFSSLGLEGFSKNIDPTRPRSFISLTAYYSLSIAGYLGYSKIHIIGLENTQFRSLALDSDGEMVLKPHHGFDESDIPLDRPARFKDGVAGYVSDTARRFADLKLFNKLPITNLDSETIIDAFPVANLSVMEEFLKIQL